MRAAHGDRWNTVEHLLADVVDLTALSIWQRSGRRNAPKPPPVPRPGVKDPNRERFGSASMTPAQYERHRRRRRQKGRKR